MWREGAVYANGKRRVNTGCYGAYHEWKIGSKAPREMSREEAWASCRGWRGVLQVNRVILAGENTVGLASHIRHGKFGEICSLGVLTFGFALLFKYVPDAEVHWRDVWLGGVATAVLFTVGKTAIGAYLGRASVGSAYGAAGSMGVLLVWVYYAALIVFFGAEFTQVWATRHGPVAPQPHAVPGAAPQTTGEMAAERSPGA
jgi:hypothetical protein